MHSVLFDHQTILPYEQSHSGPILAARRIRCFHTRTDDLYDLYDLYDLFPLDDLDLPGRVDLFLICMICMICMIPTKVILDGLKRNMSRGNSLSDELDLGSVLGDTRAYLYSPVLG